jgi:phosphoheptose isomerase
MPLQQMVFMINDTATETEMTARIRHCFGESIQTTIQAADLLPPAITLAADLLITQLLAGNKILACGNGSSACDALHFTSSMVNRFREERPALPAIALTADISLLTSIANDSNYQNVFARQVRALGQPGDILLTISASGNSSSILAAIRAAHDRQLSVLALTGAEGGKMTELLEEKDVEIRIPGTSAARIQETRLLVIHCLCDVIEYRLFGPGGHP